MADLRPYARTRIKFCGITRPQDAQAAVAAGADALGFVFYAKSPRAVTLKQVNEICQGLPPFVARVGLFLNADPAAVQATVDAVSLDLLQFHGTETADECTRYGLPYMKALGMAEDESLLSQASAHAAAAALLIDSHKLGEAGGTGEVFDWSTVPRQLERPLVLAGGLNVSNVAAAIRQLRPYAVDVSSGIESAPGRKDRQLMQDFSARVRQADRE